MNADNSQANSKEHVLRGLFDKAFYLEVYPDVAASKFDAWQHYYNFGRFEGRLPKAFGVAGLEARLWREDSDALEQIKKIAESSCCFAERALASWYLARYYVAKNQWDEAGLWLIEFWGIPLGKELIPSDAPSCLTAQVLGNLNNEWLGFHQLSEYFCYKKFSNRSNELISQYFLSSTFEAKTSYLNSLLDCNITNQLSFDALSGLESPVQIQAKQKVSVIVPCFNAEDNIITCLLSLQNQSWKNIEVIVVDDGSTDRSVAVTKRFIETDARFHLIELDENQGAYAARNIGMGIASGDFLTVLDSDDWAHPERVARQAETLSKNSRLKASISYWVRANNNLEFDCWRMNDGFVELNLSSLMIKRSVLKKIGYWDEVKAAADSEFLERFLAVFGSKSLKDVSSEQVLSVGRISSNSLTQTGATHISTSLRGTRAYYVSSYRQWHRSVQRRKLFIEPKGEYRKFSAPKALLSEVDYKRFDAEWYQDKYPDVLAARVNPHKHYKRYGANEGRDPSPYWSVSEQELIRAGDFSFEVTDAGVRFLGEKTFNSDNQTIVIFGHALEEQVMGAERTLVDTIAAVACLSYNLIVVLPAAKNTSYLRKICRHACAFHIMPMAWWHARRSLNQAVKSNIVNLLEFYKADLCYVNTITLWEPIIAAEACDIPSVMHVREVVGLDKDLLKHLLATPKAVREHLNRLPCYFWANSQFTCDWLKKQGVEDSKLSVLYDVVDSSGSKPPKDIPHTRQYDLHVGMLGGFTVKKGIKDFLEVARNLSEQRFVFHIFGSELNRSRYRLPSNVVVHGYTDNPVDAFDQLDIVLCLSHVDETFSRVAVEAMAAGKVVIAYDKGALPEVIGDGGTIVPFRDRGAVERELLMLQCKRGEFAFVANRASERGGMFSINLLASALNEELSKLKDHSINTS